MSLKQINLFGFFKDEKKEENKKKKKRTLSPEQKKKKDEKIKAHRIWKLFKSRRFPVSKFDDEDINLLKKYYNIDLGEYYE